MVFILIFIEIGQARSLYYKVTILSFVISKYFEERCFLTMKIPCFLVAIDFIYLLISAWAHNFLHFIWRSEFIMYWFLNCSRFGFRSPFKLFLCVLHMFLSFFEHFLPSGITSCQAYYPQRQLLLPAFCIFSELLNAYLCVHFSFCELDLILNLKYTK